ncbi:hypothetical protein [Marinobacter nauticus]|uniref:Methyl-accepting chemotaxis protein n=1 Tax=Marinobacter nauticus TaxID=2743 RepID=A0A368VBT9_MARNT|nr:hypothetical protein [Marinobacter nauticus]RBP76924.1 hypothetical protein DET64_101107 [Marinobacter nauticus]RCW37770.1 hypothetical protein DET51_101106 [Marinobacter nauticus]
MRWYNKSILNRILTIIVVSNLLIAIVAGIYFNRSLSSQDEYEHLISDEIVLALEAQDILSDFKTQVATAAEEQTSVSEDINRNVTEVAEISEAMHDAAEQNLRTVPELEAMARKAQELAGRIRY